MTDFQFADYDVQVDSYSELVRPPIPGLVILAVLLASSVAFIFINNAVGYALAVVASIAGGLLVFFNQKRRSNPNYVTIEWFQPTLLVVRLFVVLVALLHITMLAFEAAK